MRNHTKILALAAAAGLASPAVATDRYWVASLIGLWSDSGQWSISSGGSGGFGVPQTGDNIFLDERSICIFNGAGIVNPSFGDVTLSGVFSGVTSLQQGSSPWNADRMTIGLASDDCEFLMGGGSFIVEEMLVGKEPGGEGYFETSGTADFVATTVVDVGMNGASGSVEIGGNLFEFPEMNISFGFGNPGIGHVDVLAGTILGDDLRVGLDGRGSLFQSGGDIDVDGYTVGTQPSAPDSTSIHTGGTLDVAGFLQLAPAFGDATFTIDGADVSCGTLYMGEGPGADATLNLSTGSLDATSARIGIEGAAVLNQIGGAFTAGSVSVGELSGSDSAVWQCYGGTAMVGGDVRVGAGNTGDGELTVDGGALMCEDLIISATSNSFGFVSIESGSISADVLSVGAADAGQYLQRGGSLSATSIVVDPSAMHDSIFQVTGPDFGSVNTSSLTNNADVRVFGGVVTIGTLNNNTGASFRLGNSPDVRAPTVINDGQFTFGTAAAILSGSVTGPPLNLRLLGSFQNNGTLITSAGLAADFSMNLTNDGVVDVIGPADLDVNGSILNRGVINVDSDGGVLTAELQCDNASGIVNLGVINLDEGLVRTTNGPFNNEGGEIQGPGLIQGGLTNSGLIGRGGQLEQLRIQGGYTSSSGAVLEFQRYPGAHNSIRVTSGDAQLAGTISVDFEFFTPSPGAEYVLLTVDAGSVIGTFDTEVITDANAEIVYESNRVLVRVLSSCNAADLAEPFGQLDFSDVIAFLTAFGAMDGAADLAEPFGQWDFSDVIAFLTAFGAGCP